MQRAVVLLGSSETEAYGEPARDASPVGSSGTVATRSAVSATKLKGKSSVAKIRSDVPLALL